MGPMLTAVEQAQLKFSDPAIRAQVRAWHDEGVSFLDMVDRIGLSDLFTGPLRDAIAGLSPEEVATIRKAMIVAIDRAGKSADVVMPVNCQLDPAIGPVVVTPEDRGGEPWAKVTAAK
ncbi:MAG TPA: hypothetical protein VIK61_15390 [Acidimicrobiia bacterium]